MWETGRVSDTRMFETLLLVACKDTVAVEAGLPDCLDMYTTDLDGD